MKISTRFSITRLVYCFYIFTVSSFTSLYAQTNAPSIQSGVTFQWSDTQSAPDDSATLESITINGTVFNRLGVPTGYVMTQLGPTGNAANNIRLNGGFTETTSASGTWATSALTAFDDKNLNHYFEANGNGQNICDDFTAETTTNAQRQTLSYSPGIEVGVNSLIAVTERNANNCFYIEVSGTPAGGGAVQVLGETFVNNDSTQWGYGGTGSSSSLGTPGAINAPSTDSDYWLSDRVIDNYGTIGIALFNLVDIAPVGSTITRVQLTAATNDHGDGKVFIISFLDEDGDGIDDAFDLDDDDDGILDTVESGLNEPSLDEDGDGIPNWTDTIDDGTGDGSITNYTDTNGDGVPDVYDFDGDGIPNHFDFDSDNDGCFDALEGGDAIIVGEVLSTGALDGTIDIVTGVPDNVDTTNGQTIGPSQDASAFDTNGQCDSDNDGTIDTNDICLGFDDNANADGDVFPDGCDEDDDNDGITDVDEGLVTTPGQPACGGQTVMNFNNAYTEESGDGDINTFLLNEKFRFPGVSAGIDALVTITELNGTTIPVFDDNTSSSNSFQPQSAFSLTNVGDRAYSEFRFDFVTTGGTAGVNDVIIPEFFVNFNDVDGGPSYGEQNWSQLPNGYVVDNPTELSITHEGNFIIGTAGVIEYPGVSNNFPQINYSTVHSLKSSYTIRLGVVAREAGASASGRQHNVQFDCVTNFVSPESTTVLDTDGDGTPNHLDEDSDDDGCFDALEGDGGIILAQVDGSGMITGGINTNGIPNAANSGNGQGDVSSTNDLVVGVQCSADLSLTKTIDNATPKIGDTIAFTITLINDGPLETTGVQVLDMLPTGLLFDLGNSTIPVGTTYNDVTGIWDLSTLTINNGTTYILQIAAKITPACGEITNVAEIISSDRQDPDSTINNGN